jgi:hypothetical protein
MKDLIFITAFCPTEEQERALEKCIDSVLRCGKHIGLISHSHISIHIQKKCHYYFYDHLNDVSDNYNFLEHENFRFDDKIIQSRFFQKYFYGFAIYRMFSIASQIGINFGYENIHHIEYDCELIDKDLIEENSKLLKEYDSVIYTDNGEKNGFLFGSLKSFKIKTLPDEFKNFNREYIEVQMKKVNPTNLECVTKDLFIKSGKVLFQNIPSEERFSKSKKFYGRNLHYTLFYNPGDLTLNIFYKSIKNSREKIFVIVNEERVISIKVTPNHWHIRSLGVFDEITHVRIDNSDKIIYQKSFDNDFREIYKIKSYISDINDEENS